jgi:exonuclease SbcD
VQRGHSKVEWRKLAHIRPFIECRVKLVSDLDVTDQLKAALPGPKKLKDAVVKLTVEYPRDFEKLINEAELREHCADTFEFHLVKRPQLENRVRLAEGQNIASLSALELLEKYWQTNHTDQAEVDILQKLAAQVLSEDTAQD